MLSTMASQMKHLLELNGGYSECGSVIVVVGSKGCWIASVL